MYLEIRPNSRVFAISTLNFIKQLLFESLLRFRKILDSVVERHETGSALSDETRSCFGVEFRTHGVDVFCFDASDERLDDFFGPKVWIVGCHDVFCENAEVWRGGLEGKECEAKVA